MQIQWKQEMNLHCIRETVKTLMNVVQINSILFEFAN